VNSTFPLLVGTFFATIVRYSPAFLHLISPAGTSGSCEKLIGNEYFAQMTQVIPLLLIALGIQMGFMRRTGSDQDAVALAAPIVTVVLLCVAEFLSFSALPTRVQQSANCLNFDG
jgi:predicted permease